MDVLGDLFRANIGADETYTLDSVDNKYYDILLNPDNYKKRDWFKAFSIEIERQESKSNLVLIGSYYSDSVHCAVAENDNLIVLMNTALTVINTETLEIMKHIQISEGGIFLAIYPFDDGYIAYGELEIIKLDKDLKIQWTFSGQDVFVTQDGRNAFVIINDAIQLLDWYGNHYTVNKFGVETTSGFKQARVEWRHYI